MVDERKDAHAGGVLHVVQEGDGVEEQSPVADADEPLALEGDDVVDGRGARGPRSSEVVEGVEVLEAHEGGNGREPPDEGLPRASDGERRRGVDHALADPRQEHQGVACRRVEHPSVGAHRVLDHVGVAIAIRVGLQRIEAQGGLGAVAEPVRVLVAIDGRIGERGVFGRAGVRGKRSRAGHQAQRGGHQEAYARLRRETARRLGARGTSKRRHAGQRAATHGERQAPRQ